jgi:hypothetical protein
MAVLVLGLAGCGGGTPSLKAPPLVPVSGRVLLDGKPLEAAQVFFVPKGATAGQLAYASTDSGGGFTLMYNNGLAGCPVGDYVVQISKLMTPDGKPIPEGTTAAEVAAVDIIPARYKDPDAPQNALFIDGPKPDLVFELKSR